MGANEENVCRRYASRIWSYGVCHLKDRVAADDLVQQVLVVVLQALRNGRVDDVENLDNYVFGTCRNMVMDVRRAGARQRRLAEASASVLPDAYEQSWHLPDCSRLGRCLERLDARGRSVVVATFVDDRDAGEVARAMGLSAGNVRVLRHRAIARLRDCMSGAA